MVSFILPGNSASGGYEVANSVRLNQGDHAHFSKTPSTSNGTTFTYSFWVKRGRVDINSFMLRMIASDNSEVDLLFEPSGNIRIQDYEGVSGANKWKYVTNRLFRDTSAWMHILYVVDTNNGTASDRVQLYINGVRETSFSTATNPSSGATSALAKGEARGIGGQVGGSSNSFDGYMAEVVYVDGTAKSTTDFGEFDEDTGIWKPIDVSGMSLGSNGWYLDFEDSSSLGNDASGSNNWTSNNLTSTDQTTDTCTNNFATFNPLLNNWTAISEGNLKVTNTSQAYRDVFSTVALTSGKWYVECRIDTEIGGTYPIFGIADASQYSYPAQVNLLGRSSLGWGFQTDGNYYNNNADAGNWSTLDNGDIIGFYLDLDSSQNTLKVYKNGSSELSLNISDPVDGYYFGCSTYQEDSVSGSINFGNPSFSISSGNSDANGYGNFEYSPTLSGVNYYAICTKNLAEYG